MKVILESPYAGDIERNVAYLKKCLKDSFDRGEYPFASHAIYTNVLDDTIPEERKLGILAGLEWGKQAEKTVVYTDYGISSGMEWGIKSAQENNREIEYRTVLNK